MLPNNSTKTGYDFVDQFNKFIPEWFDLLGLMTWPLSLCAFMVMAVSMERFVFHVKLSLRWSTYYDNLEKHIIYLKDRPKVLRDEVASQILMEIQASYATGINLLRTISVISPLFGLLGTVLGIITAFKIIAAQTGPVSPNMIADGLWEAMLTTAVGLLIALPAMMAAYIFKYLADKKVRKISLKLNRLSMSYELEKHEQST